jgi:hypothetical protein
VVVRTLALSVDCESWLDVPRDLRGRVEETLARAGIGSLPGDAQGADAELRLIYRETKGAMYKVGGAGEWGTDIRLESVLTRGEERLLQVVTMTGPPERLRSGVDLTTGCREECFASPHFQYLGAFAGTALGVEACMDRLAPACLLPGVRDAAIRLLSSRGFKAGDPALRAALAAARDDFEECAASGSAALPLLLEIAMDPLAPRSRVAGASAALRKIGDPAAVPPLVALIGPHVTLTDRGPERLCPLVEVIGALGDAECLELIDSFARWAERSSFESRLTQYREVFLEDLEPRERARLLDEAWPAYRRFGETARDAAASIRSRSKR